MKMIIRLLTSIVLIAATTTVIAGTSTWTGAVDNDWTNAANWSGGTPSGPSDVIVLPAGTLNQSIINVPNITIKRISVTGGSYTLNSAGPVTLTCAAGGSGDELTVSSGASLVLSSNVSLITGGRPVNIDGSFTANGSVTCSGTVSVAGTATFNGGLTYNNLNAIAVTGTVNLAGTVTSSTASLITFSGSGTVNVPATKTCTLNQSVTFLTNMNVQGTMTVASGETVTLNPAPGNGAAVTSTGIINGAGDVVHGTGPLNINGLVVNSGNFTNSSGIFGVGTVQVGGTITNTNNMFGYTGNPPGKILSGYTWSGAVSNAWANTANWYGSLVPVSTGDAVIYLETNQPTLSTPGQACRQLYIHSGGAVLTLSPAGQLTANSMTTIGTINGLLIQSSAAGTGSFIDNGNFDGAGSALVQCYYAPDRWHGYCIPVTQTGTTPYIDYYMKWYNNTTHFYQYVIDPARTDSLLNSDGIGYMMWSSSSTTGTTPVSVSGQLNTGAMSIPVYRSADPGAPGADYDNWNFTGNPYPSAVDLSSSGIAWNNTIQEAYFWNPVSGNFEVYIKAGGGNHGGTGVNSPYAPAQQGFFVRHDTAGTAPTTFSYLNNSPRVHNTALFMKENLSNLLGVTVVNSANGYSDQGTIRFAADATKGLDENIDALKLEGDAEAPQLSFPVPGGHNLQVNVLPSFGDNLTVPMNFTMQSEANNQFAIEGTESFPYGTRILLEDRQEGIFQDMTEDNEYRFHSTPQDDPARFVWHFTNPAIGIQEQQDAVRIYTYGNRLYISNPSGSLMPAGEISVYDLLGRTLFRAPVESSPVTSFSLNLPSGYYIVSLRTQDRVRNQKVYVNDPGD